MSHQTGIRANQELRSFFGKCRNGDVRLIKVSIVNEQLTLAEHCKPVNSWEEDYEKLVFPLLECLQPCFILYRMDAAEDGTGVYWILICWLPDESPIRQKMMYASTKATLKLEFGGGQISEEVFGATKSEISLVNVQEHRRAKLSPAPMSFAEEEFQKIKMLEFGVDIGVDTQHQTMRGIAFPISDKAIRALFDMRDGKLNYVQLCLDMTEELINVSDTQPTDSSELQSRIPKDHARYHLFRFPHTHEGDYMESTFFIYSMPGYDCTIKERMMYSACKGPLLEVIIDKVRVPVDKRIELTDDIVVNKDYLLNELHPPVNVHNPQFPKPKGPPNRGAKRLTKPKPVEGDGVIV